MDTILPVCQWNNSSNFYQVIIHDNQDSEDQQKTEEEKQQFYKLHIIHSVAMNSIHGTPITTLMPKLSNMRNKQHGV